MLPDSWNVGDSGLTAVFLSGFLATTLLPGGSEAALFMGLGKLARYLVVAQAAL